MREFDRTVLVVGATGAFGERLAEGLIRSGIAVIGAARNTARLDALARRLGPRFAVEPLDRSRIDAARLQELRARWPGLFAVADASGPFQTSDYRLAARRDRRGPALCRPCRRTRLRRRQPRPRCGGARGKCRRARGSEFNACAVACRAGYAGRRLPQGHHDRGQHRARQSRAARPEYGACGPLHGRPADPRVSRLSLGRGSRMGTEQDDRTSRRRQPQGRAVRNTRPRPAR